jgi:hypothetical protein
MLNHVRSIFDEITITYFADKALETKKLHIGSIKARRSRHESHNGMMNAGRSAAGLPPQPSA